MIRFLASCRFLLVIPVIGCVIMTLAIVLMGLGRIGKMIADFASKGEFTEKAAKTLSLGVIEIIDLFLIGTVTYITAIGLYKLFIGKTEIQLPIRLKIETLKDLEFKIFGVIVAALAVAFLGQAAGSDDRDGLLQYGAGIALVIAALAFFMREEVKKSD